MNEPHVGEPPRAPSSDVNRSGSNPSDVDPGSTQSDFNPIVAERPVRRFEFLHRRPQVQARVALVLVTARGGHHVFGPKNQPTMGELIWKSARVLYEVDMGLHQTQIKAELPSEGDAFPFHAVVDVHWSVSDPWKIVSNGITDVREVLAPPMLAQLRRVTRRFDIERTAEAERAANEMLEEQPVGDRFGLSTTAFLRLTMDEPSRQHLGAVRGIDRETRVEELTQELRVMREQHNKVLLEGRVENYRAIIASGDLDQFALQLAQNPDDVPSVMGMLKDERDTNRRQTVDFVTRLIESGAIDRWEIDDQVKSALQWLQDSTHQVIANRADEPRQIAPERSRRRLGAPQLPNPALPGHADGNNTTTTGHSETTKDTPA